MEKVQLKKEQHPVPWTRGQLRRSNPTRQRPANMIELISIYLSFTAVLVVYGAQV